MSHERPQTMAPVGADGPDLSCRYMLDDREPCNEVAVADADFCPRHLRRVKDHFQVLALVHAHHLKDVELFWTRSNY